MMRSQSELCAELKIEKEATAGRSRGDKKVFENPGLKSTRNDALLLSEKRIRQVRAL